MFQIVSSFLRQLAESKNTQHTNNPQFNKRHWFLGSLMILGGSWITHATTATVYENFNNQQALAFAEAMPNNGLALNGGLPNELFVEPLKNSRGPISANTKIKQSPADHIFAALEEPLDETIYTILRGDTLGSIFKKLDLDLSLPYSISQHQTGKQLVSLSVGKDLIFKTDENQQLKQINYPVSSLEELVVDFNDGAVVDAQVDFVPYQTRQKIVSSEISSSLYEAALEAGLSNGLIMEMIRIFGWDIDFVLDIRDGDSFHVIYDEHWLDDKKLSDGNIIAAQFTTQNHTYRAIRFEDSNADVSYYNPDGESMLGTFLRSPVEVSRISSRFGRRKHPILKTWRAHKGVDYAAGRGTPIRATADGKIILAGKKGGYGKAVVLRHAGRFSTLYGHMNGYAKGIRSGARVKQGQVIGYIGSTGLATGPHLHYEFRVDGVHRNPLTYKTPKASSISPEERRQFDILTGRLTAKLDGISRAFQIARSHSQQNTSQAF